ncbi:unnamed protein product, partial [Meganyctiphanes norvegica]
MDQSHSYHHSTHTVSEVALSDFDFFDEVFLSEFLDDVFFEFSESLTVLTIMRVNYISELAFHKLRLVENNLSRVQEYEGARDSTIQKVEELTSLRANFEELTLQQQKSSDKLAPSSIQESILISAAQSEEESEKIAEDFLKSHLDVDAFLGAYLEKRIVSFLKSFK